MKFPTDLENLIKQFARSRTIKEIHFDVIKHLIKQRKNPKYKPQQFLYEFERNNTTILFNRLELDNFEKELVSDSHLRIVNNIFLMECWYKYYFRLYFFDLDNYFNTKLLEKYCEKLYSDILKCRNY